MTRGRKTKFKPEYCLELISHLKLGYSYKSFAAKIGVNVDTLYAWENKFPDFSDAKKEAMVHSLSFWEDIGLKHAQKSVAAWIFIMRSRYGYSDTPVEIEQQVIVNMKTYQPAETT